MDSAYDLIVIGSGPAGQRAAIYAAKLGKKCAVVEMREVEGGACINTGTIPSKTMREAVLHLSGYNYKSIYGMNYWVKEKITMSDLAFRVEHVIKTEVDVTQVQLSRNNVDMLVGIASFRDANHIAVTNSLWDHVYETANVLISTRTKCCIGEGAHQRTATSSTRRGAGAEQPAEDDDCGGGGVIAVHLHVLCVGRACDADCSGRPRAAGVRRSGY